jgi:hypothetical protein
MPNPPQVRGLTLVLVGDINPAIFQPRWFSSEQLLTDEEARTATIGVIHPDVTSFELSWISLVAQRDRFQVSCTAQPYFDRVVGLVWQTFERLRHTPVRMMGINNEAHYRASSVEAWHALGHRLAPKDLWKDLFPDPGLQSLTIRQVPRPDGLNGHVQVSVEPSARTIPGIFIVINEHFVIGGSEVVGAGQAIELLREKWSESVVFSEKTFSRIVEAL